MKIRTLLFIAIFILVSTEGVAGSSVRRLYNKADKSYLQGRYETAFEYCRKLLKEFKTSTLKDDTNYLAGLALLKLGRYAEARECFGRVLRQKPQSTLREEAYLGLADSYFLEGDYDEAKGLYGEILVYFPETNLRSTIDSRLKEIEKIQPKSQKTIFYTVQIGSFRKKSNARRLYRRFKKKGYSVYIFESKEDKKTFYRVRVGKFKSKGKAEAFAKRLKKQGFLAKVNIW